MRPVLAVAACVAAAVVPWRVPETRVVTLPAGTIELTAPLEVAPGTELRGSPAGTLLRAAAGFRGRALVVCRPGALIRLRDFAIDGRREMLEVRTGLAPADVPFARFTPHNGVLAEGVSGLRIERLDLREIAGFAVLVAASRQVSIHGVRIAGAGSRNAAGRNNATGGILIEEGTADFRVTACTLERVRGNGIWTHSLYTSPRNRGGLIAGNHFDTIGRDAIQVGHATAVRVLGNHGTAIGYPLEDVDLEGAAYPVAIDTAGDVDRSLYEGNRFTELSGKCIDLDGFHHGAVRGNVCVNSGERAYPAGNYGIVMNNTNPDMQSRGIEISGNLVSGFLYGGIFVIGSGHTVRGNRLLRLNTARAETDLLRAGIYLGAGAARPDAARGNLIESNFIGGYGMSRHCVAAAPGVSLAANRVGHNVCKEE